MADLKRYIEGAMPGAPEHEDGFDCPLCDVFSYTEDWAVRVDAMVTTGQVIRVEWLCPHCEQGTLRGTGNLISGTHQLSIIDTKRVRTTIQCFYDAEIRCSRERGPGRDPCAVCKLGGQHG